MKKYARNTIYWDLKWHCFCTFMVNVHTLAICQSKRFDKFHVCVYRLPMYWCLSYSLTEGGSDDVRQRKRQWRETIRGSVHILTILHDAPFWIKHVNRIDRIPLMFEILLSSLPFSNLKKKTLPKNVPFLCRFVHCFSAIWNAHTRPLQKLKWKLNEYCESKSESSIIIVKVEFTLWSGC